MTDPRCDGLRAQAQELRESADMLIRDLKDEGMREIVRHTVLIDLDDVDRVALQEHPAEEGDMWIGVGEALLESAGFALSKWQSLAVQYGQAMSSR